MHVAGWVDEENLDAFVRRLAAYTGYTWDGLDDDAFIGSLESTDADRPDTWFEYPIMGTPPVTLALGRDSGAGVVSVRVSGTLDAVLAARIETLLDVY